MNLESDESDDVDFASSFMVIEDDGAWNKTRAEIASLGGARAMERGVLLPVGHVCPHTADYLARELTVSFDGFDPLDADDGDADDETEVTRDPHWRTHELLGRRMDERRASDFELRLRGLSPTALDGEIARLQDLIPRLMKASMEGKALAHSLAPHLAGVRLTKPRGRKGGAS